MENPPNPQNSKFLEDLQKASEEIEVSFQKKKTPPGPVAETKKETPATPPPEKGFVEDLTIQAEEVAKEKKRLEEIQKNLANHQKMVAECLQELTTIEGEISKVLENKKKIDEDLQRMREKNQKIFEDLEGFKPF